MFSLVRLLMSWVLVVAFGAFGTGCDDGPSDGDADGDMDADGDVEADGDADSDSDGDTDGCTSDEQCADDRYCNGVEICDDGVCIEGEPVVCDDGDDCTTDFCSERTERCAATTRDMDDDRFGDAECGGEDCDDSNPDIRPGVVDLQCNGVDDNCDGVIDEPVPIRVTDVAGHSWSPSVAWNGTSVGVAWTEDMGLEPEIWFTELDVDGTQLMEPVAVTETWFAADPWLLWTGSEYALAFTEGIIENRYEIGFAGFDSEGIVTTSSTLTDEPFFSRLPSLAWNGTGYGVIWYDSRPTEEIFHPYFATVSEDGAFSSAEIRLSARNSDYFTSSAVVWTGSGYAVVWVENIGGSYELWFALLGADGSFIDDPISLVSRAANFSAAPRIVHTGSGFGLAWSDEGGMFFARLTADGTMESPTLILSDASSDLTSPPALIWTGTEFAMVWNDFRDFDDDIYFTRISEDGLELIDQIDISHGPNHSLVPSLAWTGEEYVMAWTDFRYSDNEIFFARVCVPE